MKLQKVTKIKDLENDRIELCKSYSKKLHPVFEQFTKDYTKKLCTFCEQSLDCKDDLKIHEAVLWFLDALGKAFFINYPFGNPIRLLYIFRNALDEYLEEIIFDTAENFLEAINQLEQQEGELDENSV